MTTVRIRRQTSTQWALQNPILPEGELVYISDHDQYKVGDGVTEWSLLPTAGTGPTGPTGPEGPTGPAGADGADGADGANPLTLGYIRIHNSADQGLTSGVSHFATLATIDASHSANYSGWYSRASNVHTIGTAGIYAVKWAAYLTGTNATIGILLNGNYDAVDKVGPEEDYGSVSLVQYFEAGDELMFMARAHATGHNLVSGVFGSHAAITRLG